MPFSGCWRRWSSVAFTESLIWLRGAFQAAYLRFLVGASGLWRLATGLLAVLGFQLFHHNGIAGDPYATLTWALDRNHAAGADGLLLCC